MKFLTQLWIALIICIYEAALKDISSISEPEFIPCEKDWFFFGEKCYKLFGKEDRLSWKNAAKRCSEEGGNLVTIQTKEQQDFLTYFLMYSEKINVWIGLHDRDRESHYVWDDGSTVNYTNWQSGEPTGWGNTLEDCAEMLYWSKDKSGKWNDIPCDYKLPYICQTNKDEQTHHPDPRFCSSERGGGLKYLDSCYHFVNEEKSWDDAEQFCQDRLNGHIVTIPNFKTMTFLNYVAPEMDKELWIGVKIQEQGTEKWASGWHLVYNKFEDPEGFKKGNCGLKTGENLWTFSACSNKFPFICETSLSEYDIPSTGDEITKDWLCPNTSKDWKDLDGDTCYIFETKNTLKWYEAHYACTTKGGVLAIIDSEKHSKSMHPYMVGTHERLLIGLHRSLDSKHVFQWVDGSDIDYENWNEGEPNDISEECGEIWTDDMKWNDIPCNIQKGYICSAKKIPPSLQEEFELIPEHKSKHKNKHKKPLKLTAGCPSHTGEQAALGVFVAIFLISIIVGTAIYCHKTPGSVYDRFKN